MSLILDALNRADQQRSEENASPNPLHHQQAILPTARPILRWVLEGVALLLIVGGIVYSLWPPGNEESQAVAGVPAFASGDPLLTITTEEKLAAEEVPESSTITIEQPEPIVKLNTPDPAIPSLYQAAQPESSKQAILETPTPKENVDNGREILQKIPLITNLSSRFQRTVPNINYQLHVYSDKENSGFVNLNGSIHKIGSQILPGMRVIAILKDSVVLDYRGTQFRLPAMNSWVNYN
ncbi:MAG: general secretion pathway protein GspB [Oceanicoccus sp.]